MLLHDAFVIKEAYHKLTKLQDSLKSKAEITEAQVNALELEASTIEVKENKLKKEFESEEEVDHLESQVKELEEKATDREGYVSLLESRLSEAITKMMGFEVQLKATDLKVQGSSPKPKRLRRKTLPSKS